MMGYTAKATVAAIALGLFGLFLIWQGLTGNVVKTTDRKAFFPRWMYVLSGMGILILPVIYLIVVLQIN